MSNPYLNHDGVLTNKLGITDKDTLRRVEYDITSHKQREILDGSALSNVKGFGFERQQAIHKHLFEDIYEWAGKQRTVPYSKTMDNGFTSIFEAPDKIQSRWTELEKNTKAFTEAKNLTHEQKVQQLTNIFVEANHLHPFPEGNGRSLQVFMQQLARTQNIELDYSKNNPKEWNHASAVSGIWGAISEVNNQKFLHKYASNLEPITKIFNEMASPIQEQSQQMKIHNEATGKLVSYGVAPYPNSSTGAKSYFAEIQTVNGENQKLWGKGISSALIESNARQGDMIHLAKTGNDGKQNTWKAEVLKTVAQQNIETARASGDSTVLKAAQQQASQQHITARAQQVATIQPDTKQKTQSDTTKNIPQKTKSKGIER